MDVLERVSRFWQGYGGAKTVIGRSVCGQPIYALFCGGGRPRILVQCAIHAREWVTALLAEEWLGRGMPVGSAAFVPLADPDGAAIALRGEGFLRTLPPARASFLRRVNGDRPFALWKANANAVDLNVNFPARWGEGARNVRAPAPENYIGPHPFSEPETRALRDLTLRFRPDAALAYHTKGREIYWEFGQRGRARRRDAALAAALAGETGYAVRPAPHSAGGYKDWCVQALGIPAFTLEAGSDGLSHPLGERELPALAAENARVPALLATWLWKKRYGS